LESNKPFARALPLSPIGHQLILYQLTHVRTLR
jgi:hypothetical protein